MNILIAGERTHTGNYEHALKELGACPVVWLPECRNAFCNPARSSLCHLSGISQTETLSRFDGLLLPGGGDIHPGFFSQEDRGSGPSDIRLDCRQFALFSAFFKMKKPILGICKGMQIINVALGGTLIQNLPGPLREAHAAGKTDQTHPTSVIPDTFLHRLYGDSLVTNSAHHQALDRLGEGLLPAQYGPGQITEGLFHMSLPILGVQWHPERMLPGQEKNPVTGDGAQVLLYFLSLCQLCCA